MRRAKPKAKQQIEVRGPIPVRREHPQTHSAW